MRAAIPAIGWIGGPGTTMAVLNRNPLSRNKGTAGHARPSCSSTSSSATSISTCATGRPARKIKTMADVIAFNMANADKALRYGQDLFLAAEATRGDLSELEYKSARAMDLMAAKERGLDAYMSQHKLDAVVFPGASGSAHRRQAGLSQRAGAGRLHLRRRQDRKRRTIRSASPSPAAPGAKPSCCASPTPTSRRSNARRPPPGLPTL